MKSIKRGGGVLSVEKMNWSYMGISKTLFHNFLGLESSKSPSLYLLALLFILFPYARQSHSLSVGVGESGLGFKPQSSLTLSTLRSHSALPAVHAKGNLSECCMKKKKFWLLICGYTCKCSEGSLAVMMTLQNTSSKITSFLFVFFTFLESSGIGIGYWSDFFNLNVENISNPFPTKHWFSYILVFNIPSHLLIISN